MNLKKIDRLQISNSKIFLFCTDCLANDNLYACVCVNVLCCVVLCVCLYRNRYYSFFNFKHFRQTLTESRNLKRRFYLQSRDTISSWFTLAIKMTLTQYIEKNSKNSFQFLCKIQLLCTFCVGVL